MADSGRERQSPEGKLPEEGASGEVAGEPIRLSWKRRLLYVSVVLVVLSTCLVIGAEWALRCFAPQPLIPRYVTDSGFGIRVHCSNIAIHHTTADYRISVRTNSIGSRADREFTYAKPPDVLRIVGLGDSFTFGYGVSVEDTYLARLERLLRADGLNVEVINLGVSGHGTAEELIMLGQRGLKFSPDLVIVGYCTNDIGDNVRSMLYGLDERGDLARRNSEYLPAVGVRDRLYSMAAYRFLAERSHLLYFVRRNLSELVQKRLHRDHAVAEGLDGDGEQRLTGALLDEIKRTCTERGVGFCLLDIPDAHRIESNLPLAYMHGVSEEDVVDVRPALKARLPKEEVYWRRSDGHWTPAGHEIAANALHDWIRKAGGPLCGGG